MSPDSTAPPRLRAALRRRRKRQRTLLTAAVVGALTLATVPVIASLAQTSPDSRATSAGVGAAQTMRVPASVVGGSVIRDSFTVSDGISSLAASGTNADWAKLVLVFGDFPTTDANITVMTRWMRQENYTDSWWQRNNPLNNGWGSGGGSGLGSYDSLVTAAENAAEALRTHPGYSEIVAAFEASSPTEVTEAAIWASPWASSNYGNGAIWSEAPVPVVKAPASAW